MAGFAFLASLAAIVLGLVAASRAASAAADIRELERRLRETERQLRGALRRLAQLDREWDLGEASEVDTPHIAATQPTPSSPRAAEISEAVARLAEEAEAVRAERREPEPVRSAVSPVPPPLPAQRRVIEPIEVAPLVPRAREWIKKLGPNDPNMGWEMALGTYWLPRIGAIALAAAIVFLLSLAFQKWGPPIRVGLGYAVSASLLALGWRLDKRYPNYARVLSAAGLALTYFVTYATYFVPFAKIFETPYVSLAGLAAIVGVWAALAQRRKSQILAGVTLGLGHFTIALTTYALASPGRYPVAGIVFLSLGGAYFLARNGWFVVASLGMLASYANHFYLMSQTDSTGTPFEFAVGLGILSTYFLVYTAAELLAPDAMRRERIPFWFRNAFAVVNTLAFLALGTLLMDGYDFAEDQQHLFRYGLAIALLVVAVVYLRVRAGDPLHNTYFVKGISAATWGLATQFDAHTLSAGLAVETALLLFAARRGGLLVTRMMAYGVGLLAISQALVTLIDVPALAYDDPGFPKLAIEAAIILVAFQFSSWLYRYTDWSVRSPARSIFDRATNGMLWQLDLLAAPPEGFTGRKPLNGMLYPYGFALAGALLGGMYAMRLTAGDDGPLALAMLSFGFAAISVPLRMRPFGLASIVMFGFAIVADLGELWDTPLEKGVPMIALLALVAIASETRYLGEREGLALLRKRAMPYILYALLTALVALHIETAIKSVTNTLIALGIAVAVGLFGTIPLHRRALAWCATGLLIWTQFHWAVSWTDESVAAYAGLAWALMALGVASERYFAAIAVRVAGPVALAASAVLFAIYLVFETGPGWIAVSGAVGAGVLLVFASATRGRTAATLGLIGLLAASLHQISTVLTDTPETLPLVLGFAVPAVGWIAVERAARPLVQRFGLAQELQPAFYVCPAIATVLLALMLFNLPHATTYYLTLSWSALGVVLFALAVAFKEKTYRFCGLAVLGLATARAAFIDTRELEALPRVFALGGLGLVLLALGYAYVRVFARAQKSPTTAD